MQESGKDVNTELTLERDIQMLRSRKTFKPAAARIVPEMSKESTLPVDSETLTKTIDEDTESTLAVDHNQSSKNILDAIRQIDGDLTWTNEERMFVIRKISKQKKLNDNTTRILSLIIGVIIGIAISQCLHNS
jgi:hypothetical protein